MFVWAAMMAVLKSMMWRVIKFWIMYKDIAAVLEILYSWMKVPIRMLS